MANCSVLLRVQGKRTTQTMLSSHAWMGSGERELTQQIKDAYEVFEFSGDMDEVKEAYAEIAQCKLELEQIQE